MVYANPGYIEILGKSTPIAYHVSVDYELRGCPIDKGQLVEVITAFLNNRRPNVTAQSVCMECKRAGRVCVMVAHGTPCLGPVTHAGCGALCPGVSPRMLWLLRSKGGAEHPGYGGRLAGARRGPGGADAGLPELQRLRRGIPQGE